MSIQTTIQAYYALIADGGPGRYRSWEHCFEFFRRTGPAGLANARDNAALHLGFYLASWGMYRGSSRLLKFDYTVHRPVVDRLAGSAFASLWERDVGAVDDDPELAGVLTNAVREIREAYGPRIDPTDTLVTKVLLGTVGCLPACDRFFIDGFKSERNSYSSLNAPFVGRVLRFCKENLEELRAEQERLATAGGVRYPLMKLVDMYFWQIGYDRWAAARGTADPEIDA
jgi:hypothetical protein